MLQCLLQCLLIFIFSASQAVPSLWSAASVIAASSEHISTVARAHPAWSRMFLEASLRIDAASASLLPHLRSCFRACLAASGWPPSLQLTTSKPGVTATSSANSASASGNVKGGADSALLPLTTPGSAIAASFASLFLSSAVLQRSQELRERGIQGANQGATPGATTSAGSAASLPVPAFSPSLPPTLSPSPSPSPPLWAMGELMAPVSEQAAQLWAAWSPSSGSSSSSGSGNGDWDGAGKWAMLLPVVYWLAPQSTTALVQHKIETY